MEYNIRKLDYQELLTILNRCDEKSVYKRINIAPDANDLHAQLSGTIAPDTFTTKSVLGIDIYKYNSYLDFEQTLIPVLFKIMLDATIGMCLKTQQYIFQKYSKERIENAFIDTGDGGFFIFETPLHALIFASNFEIIRRSYNAFHLYPKLRKIIGHVSLRYAITYDSTYQFNNNYYGRSIINNSRILSKDNLNRCLIDQGTHEWFLINIDGIENLQVVSMDEIANIYELQHYDYDLIVKGTNYFFNQKSKTRNHGIINADISKIGTITSKRTHLDIYNIHLQISINMFSAEKDGTNRRTITVSLGNLNTSGI